MVHIALVVPVNTILCYLIYYIDNKYMIIWRNMHSITTITQKTNKKNPKKKPPQLACKKFRMFRNRTIRFNNYMFGVIRKKARYTYIDFWWYLPWILVLLILINSKKKSAHIYIYIYWKNISKDTYALLFAFIVTQWFLFLPTYKRSFPFTGDMWWVQKKIGLSLYLKLGLF